MLEASRSGVSVALVQEPYTGNTGELAQPAGTRVIQAVGTKEKPVKAAVVVFGSSIDVVLDPTIITTNVVAVLIKTGATTLGVVSVYFEGDPTPLGPYLESVRRAAEAMAVPKLLIGGDVNAWSPWWGSDREDHRGEEYEAFLTGMDMHILNEGGLPTFETYRGGVLFRSCVDVTACSAKLVGSVSEWSVQRDLISSDHNAIAYTLLLGGVSQPTKIQGNKIYNTKKGDWGLFKNIFIKNLEEKELCVSNVGKLTSDQKLEECVQSYTECVSSACNMSMPKIDYRKSVRLPWWSEELDALRKDMITKKRRIRCAAAVRRQYVIADYLEARDIYEREAADAQTRSWKHFCSIQERESMWDGVYRVIRRTARNPPDVLLKNEAGGVLNPDESARKLGATFFPVDDPMDDSDIHAKVRREVSVDHIAETGMPEECLREDPPFTAPELKGAMMSFNPKKAPGLDGFTADICVAAISGDGGVFLEIANRCLSLGYFPDAWKTAVIKVLRKPGKDDYTHPKSYRPIGLLSVLGKIVEKMMVARIRWHIYPRLSPNQYGFMPQRSTEDSLYDVVSHMRTERKKKKIVLMVSLDIEGAFDNAWWPAIKRQLLRKGCPQNLYGMVASYLERRKVLIRYAGADCLIETTKGCVQGSIAGPAFWNLVLDPLLVELGSLGVYCQAFADDMVLVFSGHSGQSIGTETSRILDRVHAWGLENKLRFAPHKTYAMVVTNKLKFDPPVLSMAGVMVPLVEEIKLLGLIVDHKLNFNSHVSYVCRKAAGIYRQLSTAARTTWGLNPEIVRTMYMAVVEPVVLYASSVWAPAVDKIMVQNQLNTIQRGFAQKICRAYRTVSLHAALVLAGLLPLDLRIREHAELYELKRGRPLEQAAGRQMESRVSYEKAPHPAKRPCLTYEILDDMTETTLELHGVRGPHIFTDGSKIEGKVGAAITWWREGVEVKSSRFRLEPFCTVFQAEMYALQAAVGQTLKTSEPVVSIFSDSRSSLELLASGGTFHPIAHSVLRDISALRAGGRDVRLFWVRAHVGIPGNERADELAKDAALRLKCKAHYDRYPVSYAKRLIRLGTVDAWQRRYERGDTASVTRVYFPGVALAKKIVHNIFWDSVIAQMYTGHGGFAGYLHRFKIKESPACVCDNAEEEDILHLILACPKYASKRFELEQKLGSKLTKETLKNVIGNAAQRGMLEEFGRHVVAAANKRNK